MAGKWAVWQQNTILHMIVVSSIRTLSGIRHLRERKQAIISNQRRQQEQSNKVVEDILMKITSNAILYIVLKNSSA